VLSIEGDLVTGVVEKPSHEYSVSAGVYCLKGGGAGARARRQVLHRPGPDSTGSSGGKQVGAYHIAECWIGLGGITTSREA